MSKIIIRNAQLKDNQPTTDIKIEGSIITEIASEIEKDNEALEIDAKGNIVLPTFIESHIHPSKAYLEERMPNVSGTLDEAMRNTAELKAKFTYEDVAERAERVIRNAIKNGTTIMRAIPDVDPFAKTIGVKVLVDLKEKYKDILDLQICAFPQEGFVQTPEVYEMLEESIKMGAGIVGGCPYAEATIEDARKHIDMVFDLAKKYDLPIDMHADFGTNGEDPLNTVVELIADKTIEHGYEGRVALGHVNTLGAINPEEASRIMKKIAKAGITIAPLPATDLFMTGHAEHEKVNKPRGVAPVKLLLENGVNVVYSTNNVRNAFTPFNDVNLVTIGYLLQVVEQMGSTEERSQLVDMVTYNAAKNLGVSDTYGLEVGKNADLNIFESETKTIRDFINDQPTIQYVIKNGEVIVKKECQTELAPLLKES